MSNSIFGGYSTFSNHGTEQGIIPRFYLQMMDLAQSTFDSNIEERLHKYIRTNISDFTDFYDLFMEFKKIYIDYREGLANGKYFSLDEKGAFKHDRSSELILKKKAKEFFINGRLLIYNFGKSRVIDEGPFILNNLLIVNDHNFEKNKIQCLEDGQRGLYGFLLERIERARADFLTSFNQVRIDFEHHNFQIEDFEIKRANDRIEVVEPSLGYTNLLEEVEILYERILDLIEILMVFFLGVKAHQKTNGFMTLFRRDKFDYANLQFKFTVLPNMDQQGLTRVII